MEKISKILPSSRRFENVDLSNSQPVRPGAPSFGRPVGRMVKSSLTAVDELMQNSKLNGLSTVSDPAVVLDIADKDLELGTSEALRNNESTTDQLKFDDVKNYQAPTKNVEAQKVEEMTKKFFRIEDKSKPVDEVVNSTKVIEA